MTVFDFANGNPGTALILGIFTIMLLRSIARRAFRSLCILSRGWPTAPVDADGDVIRPISADDVANAVIEKLDERRSAGHYGRLQ